MRRGKAARGRKHVKGGEEAARGGRVGGVGRSEALVEVFVFIYRIYINVLLMLW